MPGGFLDWGGRVWGKWGMGTRDWGLGIGDWGGCVCGELGIWDWSLRTLDWGLGIGDWDGCVREGEGTSTSTSCLHALS